MNLPRRTIAELAARRGSVDPAVGQRAAQIVNDIASGTEAALRRHATELDGLAADAPLVLGGDVLERARDAVPEATRTLLERVAARIEAFARAQLACLSPLSLDSGMGHELAPLERVGCYAPGGRHPLPSSVLMTAVTARAAGVEDITVATPSRDPVMLAAAAIAGADRVLHCGGAQAIAALAHGVAVPAVDFICGPGNAYVTAAKAQVAARVGIDMLAGPSELVVVADGSASADVVARDLLAQAEHDPDAVPVLVAIGEAALAPVEEALARELATLPTADVARSSLTANGGTIIVADADEAATACNALAPEHLELAVDETTAAALRPQLRHYGARFEGLGGEVFGDYGIGPNHVLPTAGSARWTGGLSVFSFVRIRSWLRLEQVPPEILADTIALARIEGLEGHARSAAARR